MKFNLLLKGRIFSI